MPYLYKIIHSHDGLHFLLIAAADYHSQACHYAATVAGTAGVTINPATVYCENIGTAREETPSPSTIHFHLTKETAQ